jgi:nitroimidazol reductase NimA-like FMN-containing flavoprotein (pyridoxamine 5'-phosphate oxidase superfamily)
MEAGPASERTRVRRHAERGDYDRTTVEAILDEAFHGHLAFVADGQPYAIPMLHARDGDILYLHGSPQSRLLGQARGGVPLCFTVTILDGFVLARSAFNHSVNYRSAVVLGEGREITGPAEKFEALTRVVEHIVPGRSADARGPSEGELKATTVIAMTIAEASAKVRTGPPGDSKKDLELPVWAGVLPLALTAGEPAAADGCSVPVPGYVLSRLSSS